MILHSPVKWVGGKRRLLPALIANVPKKFGVYHELFAGGCSLLFAVKPNEARVKDLNADLIGVYQELQRSATPVIALLRAYPNTEEFFYRLRAAEPTDPIERAARFLYLNRACYNGLYRVNKKGKFNVPYGKYKSLEYDFNNLLNVEAYLRHNDISFAVQDYRQGLENAAPGDFVYLDPPYFGTFAGYTPEKFGEDKLQELAESVRETADRGVFVLVSNTNCPEVMEVFKGYTILTVDVAWTVGQKAESRKRKDNEVIIKAW